jgi:DNA-binding GntR family transcriptional regulator
MVREINQFTLLGYYDEHLWSNNTMNIVDLNQPIQRRTLHTELVERLREMIHAGDLVAGTKIPEKELCERFVVSRTPLREALKVLASDGLVKLTPNRGASVVELTLEDIEDVFPVMASLEALSGELACQRISDDALHQVRDMHLEMVNHYYAGNLPEYFRLNQAIHKMILQAADNRALTSTYESLAGRIARARYMANMSAERWARAVEEHNQILKSLEARDGKALAQILRDHVMTKFETVKSAFNL